MMANAMNSAIPTVEQILAGLTEIANTWWPVAVFWHVYFAVFVSALLFGIRPSKRLSGIFLGLPFLSVSGIAWLSSNPFNGILFALLGIMLIFISVKLPRESVQIAPLWALIPGIFMLIVGWVYPHFLDSSSFLPFLYAAPTGIIPCPTLSIVIGLALILNGLGSRMLSVILGVIGILFGITGVVQLGVLIDVILSGSLVILILAFVGGPGRGKKPV